jgi:CBS domain-containing protein
VRTLVERKVRHVIVVRDRKPVGVIARHDLLRAMLRVAEQAA